MPSPMGMLHTGIHKHHETWSLVQQQHDGSRMELATSPAIFHPDQLRTRVCNTTNTHSTATHTRSSYSQGCAVMSSLNVHYILTQRKITIDISVENAKFFTFVYWNIVLEISMVFLTGNLLRWYWLLSSKPKKSMSIPALLFVRQSKLWTTVHQNWTFTQPSEVLDADWLSSTADVIEASFVDVG